MKIKHQDFEVSPVLSSSKKLIRVMKLATVMLIFSAIQVSAANGNDEANIILPETDNFITGVFPQNFEQEKRIISGTVSDENGQSLPGVTIVIDGTTTGAVSDADGKFTISAEDEDVLVFSFIGYEAQHVTVGERSILNVVLKTSATELDEVVAIGYGYVKKSDLTGSVTSIKTDSEKETLN